MEIKVIKSEFLALYRNHSNPSKKASETLGLNPGDIGLNLKDMKKKYDECHEMECYNLTDSIHDQVASIIQTFEEFVALVLNHEMHHKILEDNYGIIACHQLDNIHYKIIEYEMPPDSLTLPL